MCTCINLKTKDNYFGRNLDLEYRFYEKVVVTPRNYEFKLKANENFRIKYSIIGMATVVDNYPLYADGTNEKGLSIAALNFPNNAYYNQVVEDKINITPFELIPWILGNFANIDELKEVINNLNIINIAFKEDIQLTPLHWMISDDKESLVLEQTKDGLEIYSNPIGVLTNNPEFSYHLTNINNYLNLTSDVPENRFSAEITLKTYGKGMGAIGLPGDNSSSSRFIRAAYNKTNSVCDDDEQSSVSQFFHILDSVAMVKGTNVSKDNKYDITTYSCCINASKGIYYYKTYENNQITAIKLNEKNMNSKKLEIFELIETQQINYAN